MHQTHTHTPSHANLVASARVERVAAAVWACVCVQHAHARTHTHMLRSLNHWHRRNARKGTGGGDHPPHPRHVLNPPERVIPAIAIETNEREGQWIGA